MQHAGQEHDHDQGSDALMNAPIRNNFHLEDRTQRHAPQSRPHQPESEIPQLSQTLERIGGGGRSIAGALLTSATTGEKMEEPELAMHRRCLLYRPTRCLPLLFPRRLHRSALLCFLALEH